MKRERYTGLKTKASVRTVIAGLNLWLEASTRVEPEILTVS